MKLWKAVALAAIVTATLIYVGFHAERYFSSTGFCTSCHSMTFPFEGLKRSPHWGSLGINPGCGDCHFPPGMAGKMRVHAVKGVKDILSEIRLDLSTRELFDRHREEFAEKAREEIKGWDSSPCRACHKDPRPGSEFGRASHERMKRGEATCVDCHSGIFHVE